MLYQICQGNTKNSDNCFSKGNISFLKDVSVKGLDGALKSDDSLLSGLSVYNGKVVSKALADSIDVTYTEVGDVL